MELLLTISVVIMVVYNIVKHEQIKYLLKLYNKKQDELLEEKKVTAMYYELTGGSYDTQIKEYIEEYNKGKEDSN